MAEEPDDFGITGSNDVQAREGEKVLAQEIPPDVRRASPFRSAIRDILALTMNEVHARTRLTGEKPGIKPHWLTIGAAVLWAAGENKLVKSFVERTHTRWEAMLSCDIDGVKRDLIDVFTGLPIKEKTLKRITDYLFARDERGRMYVNIDIYWKYVRELVVAGVTYIHNKRKPDEDPSTGKMIYHRPDYKKEIDIVPLVKKYKIVLTY